MQPYKISVKFFIDDPTAVDPHKFVPVFHSWIQLHLIPDHLLIDVADYAHVLWATLLLERWARRERRYRHVRPNYSLQELVS